MNTRVYVHTHTHTHTLYLPLSTHTHTLSGANNLDQLRPLLEANVMLRRTKDTVDMALPTKTRHKVRFGVGLVCEQRAPCARMEWERALEEGN